MWTWPFRRWATESPMLALWRCLRWNSDDRSRTAYAGLKVRSDTDILFPPRNRSSQRGWMVSYGLIGRFETGLQPETGFSGIVCRFLAGIK